MAIEVKLMQGIKTKYKNSAEVDIAPASGKVNSSRAPGQGACLKGMSRTITMQVFRLAAISDVEKTKLLHKNFQSQWTVKYRSRARG